MNKYIKYFEVLNATMLQKFVVSREVTGETVTCMIVVMIRSPNLMNCQL